jgi:hypothetical protein
MKGDFSRIRFNAKKHYTAVLEQQGRVSLDADANEQCAIDGYLSSTETVDVIGEYGAPANDAGFAVTVSGKEILIGAGRYYVEGLMCENTQDNLAYGNQRHLLNPSPADSTMLGELAQNGGAIQVSLQVWQRLVTALDDPCLREPALGQADTTARLQTVWRVVAAYSAPGHGDPSLDCCTQMYHPGRLLPLIHLVPVPGAMGAMTSGGTTDCSCQPIPAAGYQGLENQLYRIEIHQPGEATQATFKWSRENGSVVAAVLSISGTTVGVDSLGPDANLGFQANDWVEISDDTSLFGQTPNQPGTLYQILSIDRTGPSITLTTPAVSVDPTRNARVRRWDQSGSSAGSKGIPLAANTWQTLENGIQVNFGPGAYKSGDYWLIPARAASGQIDWPSDGNVFQSPNHVAVFNAPLACIHWDTTTKQATVESCRRIFSPLTDLVPPVTPPALHITNYSWQNDDITTLDALLYSGLTLTLDAAPTGPVSGANFIVTIEAVNTSFSTDYDALAAGQMSPLNISILDWQTTVNTTTKQIAWGLPNTVLPGQSGVNLTDQSQSRYLSVVNNINNLLGVLANFDLYPRVRVKLPGRTIFAQSGNTQSFLDGQSFGQQATRQDGKKTPCISLQMPSGNGDKASDFEGWFYLAPSNSVSSLTVNSTPPYAFTVAYNPFLSVVAGTPPVAVTPQVTVTLSHPAVMAGGVTVNLALFAQTPGVTAGNFVSLATTSLVIPQGSLSNTVSINVGGNPGVATSGTGNTYTFQIVASVKLAYGTSESQTTTFTLTGVKPPDKPPVLPPFSALK